MSDPDVPTPGSSGQEDETEQLRAEVEELRAQLDAAPPKTRRPTGWWRSVVVTILLVLVAILSPLSVVAVWAHEEVSNTDRYVETITPLASDPDIQNAIADRITTEIFNYVDIQAITTQVVDALSARGLPPQAVTGLQALATPMVNGIQSFVHDKVLEFVKSDAFQTAWIEANRVAHSQLVLALTGKSDGTVTLNNGTVSINLAAIINTVKSQLVAQGFTIAEKIPAVNATFTIMESDSLKQAQNGFEVLNTMSTILPFITLVLLIVAVVVARDKRKTIVGGMLAIAVGMLLLGLILATVRPFYLSALPSAVNQPAAAAIYDTLVGFMRTNIRGIALLALVIAFAVWVSGPGPRAVSLRRGTTSMVTGLRDRRGRGFGTGAFGEFLWSYRTILRVGIAALAALFLVFNNPITGALVIATVSVALVVWLIVELLAAPPPVDDNLVEEEAVVDAG